MREEWRVGEGWDYKGERWDFSHFSLSFSISLSLKISLHLPRAFPSLSLWLWLACRMATTPRWGPAVATRWAATAPRRWTTAPPHLSFILSFSLPLSFFLVCLVGDQRRWRGDAGCRRDGATLVPSWRQPLGQPAAEEQQQQQLMLLLLLCRRKRGERGSSFWTRSDKNPSTIWIENWR